MTAVFTDDIYDSLDPLSQMIEPFKCPVLDELAKLDDSFVLTKDQIRPFMKKIVKEDKNSVSLSDLIAEVFYGQQKMFAEHGAACSESNARAYMKIFNRSLKVEFHDEGFSFNKSKNLIIHESDLTVTKLNTSESAIFDEILKTACERIDVPSNGLESEDIQRIAELAELLDIVPERRRKGYRYWRDLVREGLERKIRSNEWRIRSSEAMFDVASMISQIAFGSGSNYHLAKINLIHIKAIARGNKPIYKISRL